MSELDYMLKIITPTLIVQQRHSQETKKAFVAGLRKLVALFELHISY